MNKKIYKKQLSVTFASDDTDEFFLEIRANKSDFFPFLFFETHNDDILVNISNGESTEFLKINIIELEQVIAESKLRLSTAKKEWLESFGE